MNSRSSRLALPTAALLVLLAGSVMDAYAVGNRGGGGGGGGAARGGDFSRSGPAASGSLSGQRGAAGAGGGSAAATGARQAGATERSGQRAATTQTASRQAGATERSGQRAETQQTRTESRADTRTSGQQERTEREGQRQQGQTERTDARQQGQTERTESRSTAAQNISGNWDGHHYDDNNDEWGYALAGAAVGATAGYIAGAATATPTYAAAPTYVTVLPCTPIVVSAGGVSYYGCGGTWYNRSYVNGTVSYVTVAPPPGH